jgi:hypothetical protein
VQHDHRGDDLDDLTPQALAFYRGRFRCVDCGYCTLCGGEYYMVADQLWAASGMKPDGGMLCLACLKRRIGRELGIGDFFRAKVPTRDAWQRHVATLR